MTTYILLTSVLDLKLVISFFRLFEALAETASIDGIFDGQTAQL